MGLRSVIEPIVFFSFAVMSQLKSYVSKLPLKMLFLHWKTLELRGASSPEPPPRALPQDPTKALKWTSGPDATRLVRVVCFNFFKPLDQWGTQPSLAHGHPQAKLHHCLKIQLTIFNDWVLVILLLHSCLSWAVHTYTQGCQLLRIAWGEEPKHEKKKR